MAKKIKNFCKIESRSQLEIFWTTDYSKFTFISYNRSIKPSKINNMSKDMKKYGYLKHYPILCTQDGRVLDGQTRLMTAKKLKIPFIYTVIPDNEIRQLLNYDKQTELTDKDINKFIILINKEAQNWSFDDYLNSWAKLKIYGYIQFKKLMRTFNLSITEAKQVTGVRINTGGFKEGDFSPTKDEIKDWHTRAEWAMELFDIESIPEYIKESEGFRKALLNCCGHKKIYDHERMVMQLEKYGGRFGNCGKNMGDYIAVLNNNIINVNYPKKSHIYFSTTKN